MKVVQTSITNKLYSEIEQALETGRWNSVADFVRDAIREKIDSVLGTGKSLQPKKGEDKQLVLEVSA